MNQVGMTCKFVPGLWNVTLFSVDSPEVQLCAHPLFTCFKLVCDG